MITTLPTTTTISSPILHVSSQDPLSLFAFALGTIQGNLKGGKAIAFLDDHNQTQAQEVFDELGSLVGITEANVLFDSVITPQTHKSGPVLADEDTLSAILHTAESHQNSIDIVVIEKIELPDEPSQDTVIRINKLSECFKRLGVKLIIGSIEGTDEYQILTAADVPRTAV